MTDKHKIVDKFHRALDILNIEYDSETGRLSEPIVMVAYETHRKVTVERVLLFNRFFLIFDEDKNDVKKIFYDKVHSFRSTVKKIE